MFRIFVGIVFVLCFTTVFLAAQESPVDEGRIISVSGNTATVHFERISPGVGDEVEFIRRREIIDPVSLKVRGATEFKVGYGLVEDIGLGKTSVNIISLEDGIESLEMTDKARVTGREKKIVRRNRVVGRIQELIGQNEIEIDVGLNDEINEGDMFLIQRTEITYDPDTKEITGEKQVEVGRGMVNSVSDKTSKGDVRLNPGIELNVETDDIVFEPTVIQEPLSTAVNSDQVMNLKKRVSYLEKEVTALRVRVDSLFNEQKNQQKEFSLFQADMENVVAILQSSERDGVTMRLRNDEPVDETGQPLSDYENALAICLKGEFDKAIAMFLSFLEKFPDIPLTENCRYWIGQSYYSKGDFLIAAEWFRSVKTNTRHTHKDDDASIMLGITYYLSGDTNAALNEFRYFMLNYSESEYRNKVERWIERLS